MSSEKYIGLDVHQATISVAVMDSQGKIIMESILETKASTILDFFAGLRGTLSVTFEEGTSAAIGARRILDCFSRSSFSNASAVESCKRETSTVAIGTASAAATS
jgi:hypothetical protein